MDFINATPLPAALVPNAEHDRVVALVVVAATYEIVKGRLVVAEEQAPLLLAPPPPEIGDSHITKVGTSVCATGYAYAPKPGARRGLVRLRVGEIDRDIAVFGTRVWSQGLGGDLSPTDPRPFDRVEMSWENAYGGSVFRESTVIKLPGGGEGIAPEHDEAYALNFDGVGFYPDRADAVDQPLPLLEDPEALIKSYKDRPEPVCFAPYPMHGAMRALTAVRDGEVDLSLQGHVLSRAAPRTTFGEIPPGTRIVLAGMRPDGEVLAFDVPPPPVSADVRVGRRGRRLDLYVDAIDIDAEASRARIAYRAVFTYELLQYEYRVTLVEATELFSRMVLSKKG